MALSRYVTRSCDCIAPKGMGYPRPIEPCKCGNRFVTEKERDRGLLPRTDGVPSDNWGDLPQGYEPTPRRRSKPLKSNGFKTSPVQKRATKGRACIVCGKDEAEAIIDPAHVTPRRMAPHCTCEKGVVPLCRDCHTRYDDLNEPFDLLPYLMANGLYEETVHGFLEHGVSLRELMDTITGVKWAPKERSAA